MPTLTDEAVLEEARLASLRPSSMPPPAAAAALSNHAPTNEDIEVVWAPEPEDHELVATYTVLLGSLARVPMVTVPFEELARLSLDNRVGFLLAMADGASSIQTLLDVAGMPALEVLRALVMLEERGIVGFRD